MKKLLIIILLLVGCSPIIKIDDRMSFESTKYYRESIQPQPKINLTISDDLKKLVIARRSSGFVGGAFENVFNVGHVLSLYIEQAVHETFIQQCQEQCAEVSIKSNSFELEFTNSAAALWMDKPNIIDWVKISAEIEVTYNKNLKKTYPLKTEIDLSASQVMGTHQKDKAVSMALEDITKQLIGHIVEDLKAGK